MSELSWAMTAGTARTRFASGGAPAVTSSEGLRAEQVGIETLPQLRDAWADLAGRALEPNVFLEPGFAIPLMQHVASGHIRDVLIVWAPAESGSCEQMIGLLPVGWPRLGAGSAHGYHHKLVVSGTPLLDRRHGPAAFAAMLDWMARHRPLSGALVLTGIPADGPFMADVVGGLVRRVAILASYDRAVLRHARSGDGNVLSLRSAKTRKERKRQRRRLADHGHRAYVSARTPEAVARAVDVFLALEHKGWKGDRGTALLAHAATATFARSMTRQMACDGKCRIDALEAGGEAVATGIVLTSGSYAYFWKTAFDEDLAPLSPGVQFAIDLADVQLATAGVLLTDSCAVPNHPMIDKLWPDRLRIVDVAIAPAADRGTAFAVAVGLERARRGLRRWLRWSLRGLRHRARGSRRIREPRKHAFRLWLRR